MTERASQSKDPVPEFKSIEEEAEFWDTHDTTDYPEYWKPAKVRFANPLKHSFLIDMDTKTIGELGSLARRKGVSASELAGAWVRERLAQEIENQTR
jgi:hypothetical protein